MLNYSNPYYLGFFVDRKITSAFENVMNGNVSTDIKFDKEKNTLVEPYLPNHQIGIVHFAGKNNDQIRNDKNFISKVKATDGSLVEMKLRFNN